MRHAGPAIPFTLGLVALGILFTLGPAPGLPAPAQAQGLPPGASCGDRQELLQQLREKYRETPGGFGMTGNGAVVELFTGEDGSWTLVLSLPNGRACLIAAGSGWETIPRLKGRDT